MREMVQDVGKQLQCKIQETSMMKYVLISLIILFCIFQIVYSQIIWHYFGVLLLEFNMG